MSDLLNQNLLEANDNINELTRDLKNISRQEASDLLNQSPVEADENINEFKPVQEKMKYPLTEENSRFQRYRSINMLQDPKGRQDNNKRRKRIPRN